MTQIQRGVFITTDGIDGGGKTGLIDQLSTWLTSLGVEHICTREPGGRGVNQAIRELLLDPAYTWTPRAELMLYLADRAQHVAQVIEPALREGRVVLCDRYIDSTYAYQAWGRGMDKAVIEAACAFVVGETMPDCTLVLDIDPDLARARLTAAGKGDRMDSQSPLFYKRAREGFWELADRHKTRIRVIDASQAPEDVLACAKAVTGKVLGPRYRLASQVVDIRVDPQGEHGILRWAR